MKCRTSPYRRHRFPPTIIQHAVWLNYRFNLSHRNVEDMLARRDAAAARRFLRHVLAHLDGEPRTIVTDKLAGYAVALRELLPSAAHETVRYADNRAELSHQPTRVRERGMRWFSPSFRRNDSPASTPPSRTFSTWATTW